MKILPVNLNGPHVAFSALLEDGEVYVETWTVTEDDATAESYGVARDATKEDAERLFPEFEALALLRETPVVEMGTFLDLVSGKTLTDSQVESAFAEASE